MRLLTKAMKVSRSAYYAWAMRAAKPEVKEASIKTAVKELFYFHRRTYGSKRLSDELKSGGVSIGDF